MEIKICIASNPNDILTEFFTTGSYDIRHKTLHLSYSPAMDILKSSNIERLLFAYFGAVRTKELMESLDTKLFFTLTKQELAQLQETFEAQSFSDVECLHGIKEAFVNGYMLDPHTSNAYLFAKQRQKVTQETQVIISTAHFSKFAKAVLLALSSSNANDIESLNDKEALHRIIQIIQQQYHTPIKLDSAITELFTKKEVHTTCYEPNTLQEHIITWL